MTEQGNAVWKAVWQVALVSALAWAELELPRVIRFSSHAANYILLCAPWATPFLALRPVLRLRGRARGWGLGLLIPSLCLSLLILLIAASGGEALRRPLQTYESGGSTVELQDYDYGGAVGVHGLNLEQRRPVVSGIFIVRSLDFFDDARAGTLSLGKPNSARVHAEGSYDNPNFVADRTYLIKPWVYF
jgi:hypothetical protein